MTTHSFVFLKTKNLFFFFYSYDARKSIFALSALLVLKYLNPRTAASRVLRFYIWVGFVCQ